MATHIIGTRREWLAARLALRGVVTMSTAANNAGGPKANACSPDDDSKIGVIATGDMRRARPPAPLRRVDVTRR